MPKRHLLSLLVPLVAAALLTLSVHARAQTRVALVIGNSGYQKVVNLANPAHDAQDVSESLKRLGFTVKTVIDADFNGFRRAVLEFGRMALNADMAVFYFAGHGVEINGNNWLLPTDVELKDEADASTEAMGLQSAMQAVAAAKTLGLVILDACRNNPFQSMRRAGATRSVHVLGLAAVEPTENVLVAYAARDGTVAADGAGRNSPYTTALLKHLETPGLEVDFLFRNVRDDVMAATKNEQQPFLYGSLSSDEIYFKAPPAVVDAAPPPDASEIAWSFLRATNDVSTLSRFVDRFPESAHISEAKVRIAALDAPPAPTAIDVALPPLVHLATFVDTEFDQAEKAVARRFVRDTPAVEQAWNAIKETKDHTVIRHFVERFPSKTRRVAAETHLAALGQKPITVHVAPPQPLDVDEAVLAQAAADPDVQRCFELGDQTAAECQRAFERFPDIGHFAEDIRFTLSFCQAMGNPGGCVPTVKTTWNFPTPKPDGGSPVGVAGGGTTPPVLPSPAPSPGPPGPCKVCSPPPGKNQNGNGNANNNANANNSGGMKGLKSSHHGHMGGGHMGGGSNASNSRITTTSLKVTAAGTTGVKATTVTTPTPNTSNVRVNPNVKVNANMKLNLRVPTPNIHLPLH